MRALRFRLGSVPVSIDPTFAFLALLLGRAFFSWPAALAAWVVVAAVSVLLHELGHAVAFRAYGHSPAIVLHGMGGVTTGGGGRPLTPVRSIVVSLAGPAFGLALGAAAYGAALAGVVDRGTLGGVIVAQLIEANFLWTIFNVLPVLPLDGGQAFASVLDLLTGGRGRKPALVVSVAIGIAGALWALSRGEVWILLLVGLFTAGNLRELTGSKRTAPRDLHGDEVRAALAAGDVERAARALEAMDAPPVRLRAAVAAAQGRQDEAVELLRQAFQLRPTARSGAEYVEGLIRAGDLSTARRVLDDAPADALRATIASDPDFAHLHNHPTLGTRLPETDPR